jgi:hypothetical protein
LKSFFSKLNVLTSILKVSLYRFPLQRYKINFLRFHWQTLADLMDFAQIVVDKT